LRGRQANSRGIPHGFAHQLDELLALRGDDFGRAQGFPCLPEDRFSDLYYLQPHAQNCA
jgi:hypothetical protein